MIEELCSTLASLFALTPDFKLKLKTKKFYYVLVFNSQKFMMVGKCVS
jgi:hypothetical protein